MEDNEDNYNKTNNDEAVEESSESSSSCKDIKEDENINENEKLSNGDLLLINGDALIDYKISKRKKPNKKTSIIINLLNDF